MQPDLSTNYLGLTLQNPVIVSAAGITETADRIARCADHGAGAVVMKTMTDLAVIRNSPTPRFRLIGKDRGLKHFTLYSYEQASRFGPREYAREIEKSRKLVSIPVIGSIACSSDESWVETARMIEDAGAPALELCLSCPHAPDACAKRPDADACPPSIEKQIIDITGLVSSSVGIPVVPKLTGQLTDPSGVALGVQQAGAQGVVMFNRFPGLDIDIETQSPVMHGGFAGHGGPWAIHYPLRWITEIAPMLEIDVAATSGVMSGEDAVKYLLAGAAAVQICTVVIVRGYKSIEEITSGIAGYLSRHDYRSISQIKGLLCSRILGPNEIDRRQRVRAVIDSGKCARCGACFRSCFIGAVEQGSDDSFTVTADCAGCGLCTQVCSTGAISLFVVR